MSTASVTRSAFLDQLKSPLPPMVRIAEHYMDLELDAECWILEILKHTSHGSCELQTHCLIFPFDKSHPPSQELLYRRSYM